MKKILTIALIFISINMNAQWVMKNPSSFGGINSFSFYSKNNVWFSLVGGDLYNLNLEKKIIKKIYKGGSNISNISFVDSSYGFISSGNNILRTINGGTNWDTVNTYGSMTKFFSKEKGISVIEYQGIYVTSDGGKSWNKKVGCYILDSFNMVNQFYGTFITHVPFMYNNVYAYYKTTDGGNNWIEYDSKTLDPLESLFTKVSLDNRPEWYINPNSDFPNSVSPTLLKILGNTLNGNFYENNLLIEKIWVVDSLINYALTKSFADYVIIKTINGGKNWESMNSVPYDYTTDIGFKMFDTNNGILTSRNSIQITRDGCTSFEKVFEIDNRNSFNEDLLDIYSKDSTNIWAVSNKGSFINSTDKGNYWQVKINNNLNALVQAKFLDSQTSYGISNNIFYSTTDQGLTWKSYDFSQELIGAARLLHMFFVDKNYGWICAENHTLFSTKDGGNTWEVNHLNIQSPSNDHVQSSYFFDRNNGFLLVGERYIWETDDGGKTFSKIPFEDWYVIKQFSCFSKEEWWLSTMGFGIRKTTDGGKNWVLVNPPTNNPLYNDYPMRPIYSIGKGIKYLPGWNGEIYKTTDDGITWNKTVLANSDLRIKFDNLLVFQEKDAWLVGSKGAIFYNQLKNNSVIKPQIIPNDYYLFQNYPNPFNPTTTIKYSIPNVETRHASSLQHITLKVYDMLGREVATLVNEEKAPGNYELKFDGGNLTSGVYFYRLQASSFSETKKFMLLK